MSYVESSRYESIRGLELEIQQTHDRLQKMKSDLEKVKNNRALGLLNLVGDRAVIRFAKKYGGGTTYHYAAIKSGGWWYITSNGTEWKRRVEELKMFIGDNPVEIMKPDREI